VTYEEWGSDELNEGNFNEAIEFIDNGFLYEIGTSGENSGNRYFILKKVNRNNDIEKLCRIYIDFPKYITGYNEIGILDDHEKSLLIENLTNNDHPLGNGWERIFDNFNYANGYKIQGKIEQTEMPDYTKL
jgi:hypothetical protein